MIARAALLGFCLLGTPVAVGAQQDAKVARVGYLATRLTGGDPGPREAFLQGLRDLGYLEGKNLVIEYRDAAGKPERFPDLARELVAKKVDVLMTAGGTLAVLAAKRATTIIPIVFGAVGDPVDEGLVASLARPGGNVTGLAVNSPELTSKSLDLLKQAVPGLTRVALLVKPDSMPEKTWNERLKTWNLAARGLGLKLHVAEARGPEDFDRAFVEAARAGAQALNIVPTPVFSLASAQRRLVELAAKHRLPAISAFTPDVEAGGLMSYGPDFPGMQRRAAGYVDKILKGARPADLPIELPTKFNLAINLRTARALGLTISPTLLQRADQVIE